MVGVADIQNAFRGPLGKSSALRHFGTSARLLFGSVIVFACNGSDGDSKDPPGGDTDTDLIGEHGVVSCDSTCDLVLNSDASHAEDCLSESERAAWYAAGWRWTGGPHRLVVDDQQCSEVICLDSCDEVDGQGLAQALCDDACFELLTAAPAIDPAEWEDRFFNNKASGCQFDSLGLAFEMSCSPDLPDCILHPNLNQECSAPQSGADFDFVVDPIISTTVITITGVGSASVPMSGHLYVSSSPSEFLAGSVDGPAISLSGVSYAATHAWFDMPIDIATSGLSFTVTPSEASKAWAAGFDSSLGLFEFYDLQPTQTTTGSINPTAGTWQLQYSVAKPFGTIAVNMGGEAVAN